MKPPEETVREIKKLSIPAMTALVGVALLGLGLFLVLLFWHFSREEQILDDQAKAGFQILYGIQGTDPAFILLSLGKERTSLSPTVLRGWSEQIRSVLRSLPPLPFPWTPSDLRMIARLDRPFARYFQELARPAGQKDRISSTFRDILTIRQTLSRSVVRTMHHLDDTSMNLAKELVWIEGGILGTGLAAFGLFSFSVFLHRNTRNKMMEISSSEAYLNTLIEAVPAALFLKDAEGRWLKVNRAGLDLFDLFEKPWQNRTDIELSREYPLFREALETCRARDLAAWERGKPTVAIECVPREDGTVLKLETTKVPVKNPDGSPLGLVVSAYDLTEHLRFEELLRRYQRIFESAAEGIVITDEDRTIVDVNPAFCRVTGYSREEVLGQTPRILHSGRQTVEFYRAMWTSLETRGSWEGEIWNRRKSGEIYCEHLEVDTLIGDDQVKNYVGIFSDITARKENEERIVHLAFHDSLTDLPNRRAFKRKIEEALAQANRKRGYHLAIGILDLDGFKEVNDRLGHPAGDDLLIQVSKRLKSVFRETDTLARLGGDEFGLLLSEGENVEAFFDRIMKTLREPFEIGSERVTISGSLGTTLVPPDRADADLLIAHADLALYRVKNRGRNGWAPFQQEMEESLELRHRILTEFERALSKGELLLHYQPQVNMTTGEVIGVEALLRWDHPERGLLLPSEFIDVVEKSELIAPLGHFVLEEALAQQRRWTEGGLDLRISVNIGARHFLSESFGEDLERVAAYHGACPMTLELEVTETEALKDLSQAQKVIEKCRAFGIAVSLDDFGTGQASLTSLQNLSVEEIKIDQGFALKIRSSRKDRAIVSSLVVVGRMMEIDVMVEGVETEEDGRALIDMGCELAQGYAIARPMPAEEIPQWVAIWKPFESWTRKILPAHSDKRNENRATP
ncbi:MAG: putative bifunctional diguanylate cyclase/phosphodiesterase [Leptospirales bacterium]